MHQGDRREALLLGIDTGGTYTDAVIYCETRGVLAKAKALTTRHDLTLGIGGAVNSVLEKGGFEADAISLVSMSTTLATNALVEGQGGGVGLVMVGFGDADLDRDGLRAALGGDPVVFIPGGHDVHGNETQLDLTGLDPWLDVRGAQVTAFAVCAYFAVRNPAHEITICEMLRARTGLPVTASHELSARLGGPRRALTTLLNARLIGLIDRLILSTKRFLAARGIEAPLMVVRGDGALVSASFAHDRPIETILSGPAASLVGAHCLTGIDNAIVSDIGGTTTDIALLAGGQPRLDPEGAMVGGYRTMVEAVAMRTYGLGGDSEVSLEEGALEPVLRLGPRRLTPLSLAETLHPGLVLPQLERQLNQIQPGRLDGRFAFTAGLPARFAAGLTEAESRLYERLSERPQALDRLISGGMEQAILQRLVGRGLALICGFTPSDAAHAAGRQATWNSDAARAGAALFARRRDGRGQPIARDGVEISLRVLARLARLSAEAILDTTLAEDGFDSAMTARNTVIQRALDGAQGITRIALSLDRPVVGLGASAALHYAGLGMLLGTECVLPEHMDVANAVGAVAGRVSAVAEASVSRLGEGSFRVSAGALMRDFADEAAAIGFAEEQARGLAALRAAEAGAESSVAAVARDISATEVDGQRIFIEAKVTARASGRPRIAV